MTRQHFKLFLLLPLSVLVLYTVTQSLCVSLPLSQQSWTDGRIKTHQTFTTSQTQASSHSLPDITPTCTYTYLPRRKLSIIFKEFDGAEWYRSSLWPTQCLSKKDPICSALLQLNVMHSLCCGHFGQGLSLWHIESIRLVLLQPWVPRVQYLKQREKGDREAERTKMMSQGRERRRVRGGKGGGGVYWGG